MSWKRHLGWNEPPIDPFNAPDPIMPGGEPDFEPAREHPDPDDGIGRIARRNEMKEPGHFLHRARRDEPTAPSRSTSPVTPEDAPAPQNTPRVPEKPARRRQAPFRAASATTPSTSEERGKTRRKSLGCIVALIIAFTLFSNLFGLLASGCSAMMDIFFESDADSSYDYDYDYEYEYSDEYDHEAESAAEEAGDAKAWEITADNLESMVNAEEPFLGSTVEALGQTIESYTGYTADELGIDTEAAARSLLERSSYEIDHSYTFVDPASEGYALDCSIYFYVHFPNYRDAVSELSETIWDLEAEGFLEDGTLPEDLSAQIREDFTTLLDETSDEERYLYLELVGTADEEGGNVQVSLADGAWDETFRYSLLGLY